MDKYWEDKIVPVLYEKLGENGRKFFKEVYARDGDFISEHFGAGMQVRNMIRESFPGIDQEVGNLDDHYCDILLRVIAVPSEPVNRLDAVE